MSKGKMIGLGVAALAAMVIAGAVAWNQLEEPQKQQLSDWLRTHAVPDSGQSADADEIAQAEKNMRRIFSSAQNTFIHRNGARMAGSIEELGAGFRVGEHGALIYEDIWEARYRADGQMPAGPYRYAVLPVSGLSSEQDDARTTCIVAVPTREGRPALLMLAGPVVNDPQDFLKAWPIRRIEAADARARIEGAVKRGRAFGPDMVDLCK